jgi:prepilin-type N-terminal cleavage/methylation domain-containing protein
MFTTKIATTRTRIGFTLIELLVVIAIIALLIGLLLPALGRARKAGRLVVSLANVRSISTANFTYQTDQKGFTAIVPLRGAGRGQIPQSQMNTLQGFSSWTYGGKNSNQAWATGRGAPFSVPGQVFDYEAADRPLNRYITDATIEPLAPNAVLSSNAADRVNFQIPFFQDPGDKASYQQDFADATDGNDATQPSISTDPVTGQLLSSYDDVGTSYHANVKWHQRLEELEGSRSTGGNGNAFQRAFYRGLNMMQKAEGFTPSTFCWLHDQTADLVANSSTRAFQFRNGYGDINKSVMGFFDGHASYITVRPGGGGITANPESFSNSEYTFFFDLLPEFRR